MPLLSQLSASFSTVLKDGMSGKPLCRKGSRAPFSTISSFSTFLGAGQIRRPAPRCQKIYIRKKIRYRALANKIHIKKKVRYWCYISPISNFLSNIYISKSDFSKPAWKPAESADSAESLAFSRQNSLCHKGSCSAPTFSTVLKVAESWNLGQLAA